MMKYGWIGMIALIIFSCGSQNARIAYKDAPGFEQYMIQVDPSISRPFVFSNNESAFYYGETGKIRTDEFAGFHVREHKYLDDYILKIDGTALSREYADSVKFYFDRIERFYSGGVTEKLMLLHKTNCLLLELSSPNVMSFEFTPLISGRNDANDFRYSWSDRKNSFIISERNLKKRPPYLAIKFNNSTSFSDTKSDANDPLASEFRPGTFTCISNQLFIAIAVGEGGGRTEALAADVLKSIDYNRIEKKLHIARILKKRTIRTNNPDFDKAFAWAVVSMDQLIMNHPVKGTPVNGIYAGLPWFNNYSGRDTFISLPGALLATGRLAEARTILEQFARFQQTDKDDSNYGRLPNRITSTDIVYNAADGTSWFINALWEYYHYSGDLEFLEKMYPVVERSIEGTLKFHTDNYYFLTHDNAETWMDAYSKQGAYSPRGNRAVEVQALWYQQLLIGSKISALLQMNQNESKWIKIAEHLQSKFVHFFWNDQKKRLYDHIDITGRPDQKIRPNQIFAVTVPGQPLLQPEQELMVTRVVVSKLTYKYGVASLWQHDVDFHPYHVYPKYYQKDEAYHNGTVCGWLAGPVISAMFKFNYDDLAMELLRAEAHQIIDRGTVGTLSELLDALPKKGEKFPQTSGAVSQAWNLAEFIRNIYQDLLGIRPDVPQRKIILRPHIPVGMSAIHYMIPFVADSIFINMRKTRSEFELELDYADGQAPWNIELKYPENKTSDICVTEEINPGQKLKFNINFHRKSPLMVNDKQAAYQLEDRYIGENLFTFLSFAVPQLDKNIKSLKLAD